MPFPATDFRPQFDDHFFAPDFSPLFSNNPLYPLVVTWIEWNSSQTPGTTLGTSITTLNFGNVDSTDLASADFPVQAGNHSYAKYVKVQFSGSFVEISNAKIWKSSGDYVTGELIKFSGSIGMSTPSTSDISVGFGLGTDNIPTSLPGSSNLILAHGHTTEGTLPLTTEDESSPGFYSGSRTDLVVFQAQTSSSTPAGNTNLKTISLTYDRV